MLSNRTRKYWASAEKETKKRTRKIRIETAPPSIIPPAAQPPLINTPIPAAQHIPTPAAAPIAPPPPAMPADTVVVPIVPPLPRKKTTKKVRIEETIVAPEPTPVSSVQPPLPPKTTKKRIRIAPSVVTTTGLPATPVTEIKTPEPIIVPKHRTTPTPKKDGPISVPDVAAAVVATEEPVFSAVNTKHLRELNKELLEEKKEHDDFANVPPITEYSFLYPHFNDPNFSQKIAQKKEFSDFLYDGEIRDVKSYSNFLCRAPFELAPHQNFVKNFLSFQTPYKSLLLYHGLGTGKTCSGIGITEEMRAFMRQTGISQKIIIVASPNVQGNFRKELFNEARLEEQDGIWSLHTCIGNKLLKEINPTNVRNIPREKIVSQINTLINNYYEFMGYTEFSHFIEKKIGLSGEFSAEEKRKYEIQQLKKYFNNRFILIDEVHNITSEKNINMEKKKKMGGVSLSTNLMKIARYCDNVKLLLLSATPMYNKHTEILWLVNLMNLNDGRPLIKIGDVFMKNGEFRPRTVESKENGEELLLRKLIGYVSYVRGENPYTFPFRLYPRDFGAKTYITIAGSTDAAAGEDYPYPKRKINGFPIQEPLKYIQVYPTKIGEEQEKGYMRVISSIRGKNPDAFDEDEFNEDENMGYNKLIAPLEALNMIYPEVDEYSTSASATAAEDDEDDEDGILPPITGKRGLRKINKFEGMVVPAGDYIFDYKPAVLEKKGRIFSKQHIHKYSHKIADICDNIKRGAEGIILIYSFNIDGGLVPMALALEEMGFQRFSSTSGTKSLFEKPPVEPIDANTMMTKSELVERAETSTGEIAFTPARYVMITGDKRFSKNNTEDLKHVVSPENKMGEKIKVVLISLSGSEGLDFKCIRQVHIMDSWYNMSRIEQIIGRGVRNLSHCSLPFEKRNVEIYLHTTQLNFAEEDEAADLYLYRKAEQKAIQIGRVSRILKRAAADCILNIGQTNYTVEKINQLAENQTIKIKSSSGKDFTFRVGDKPYTSICDYMETCDYSCVAAVGAETTSSGEEASLTNLTTYDEVFMDRNRDLIMKRIRQLYREQPAYKRADLVAQINAVKKYPIDQIYYALTAFINNENEYLIDRMGRYGTMVNRGDVYAFQPVEINDKGATLYERNIPIDYKRDKIRVDIPNSIPLTAEDIAQAAATAATAPPPSATARVTTTATAAAALPPSSVAAATANPLPAPTLIRKANIPPFMEEFHKLMSLYETGDEKDKSWYTYAKMASKLANAHGVSNDMTRKYVIQHMVDIYPNKIEMIRWVYENRDNTNSFSAFEKEVYEYLKKTEMHTSDNQIGYLSISPEQGSNKWIIYLAPTFEIADQTEMEDFHQELMRFVYKVETYNPMIGFIGEFKEREFVFKYKNMEQKRNNKGVYCASSSGKSEILKVINYVLGAQIYTDDNTLRIVKPIFCCLLEFLFRTNKEKYGKERAWFFSTEEASINGVKNK